MNLSRFACALLPLLLLSCAESGGPVTVDAAWNLTCPADSDVDCPGAPVETCLGNGGFRQIEGSHGEMSCTGEPIVALCEAVERSDGTRTVTLEANVGNQFAFELRGASVNVGGAVQQAGCRVTIIEDEVPYEIGQMPSSTGNCGEDPPSEEQPCQLSNVVVEGSDVVFDLECDSLLSSTTVQGYDVGAIGGGPTTIRFANCSGF